MNKKSISRLFGGMLLTGMLALTLPAFVTVPAFEEGKPPRRVEKAMAEWKKILTPEQFYVTRQEGTERPFTSSLTDNHEHGEFRCVNCHEPLFKSETKFNSGTGWPSFYAPINRNVVKDIRDARYGMVRTEVQCAVCDAHLGHVFNDGPKPTGLRYCMNGVALEFVKK